MEFLDIFGHFYLNHLSPLWGYFFFLWLSGFRLMADRVIFNIGQVVCLHHEWLMIGVQCQLIICRGHIRACKGVFQIFFWVDGSMAN